MIERQLTLCANGRAALSGYAGGLQLGYAQNAGIYRLRVTLADEWDGLTVRAFWHLPGQDKPLTTLLEESGIAVPALVTALGGQGTVTFEGSDGSRTVASASVPYTVLSNAGTRDPDFPEPGTPAWQQFLAAMQTQFRQSLQDIKDSTLDGTGLTQTEKNLILALFEASAYTDAQAKAKFEALNTLWNGGTPDVPDVPTVVPVQSVTLSKATLTLTEGDSETLTATVLPSNTTDKTVTWTVSPAGYAAVSGGVVTALKEGSCTITATAGGKSATCAVTVEAAAFGGIVLPAPLYKLASAKAFAATNKEYLDTGIKLFSTIDPQPSWTILLEVQGDALAAAANTYTLLSCFSEDSSSHGLLYAVWGNGNLGFNLYSTSGPFINLSYLNGSKVRIALVISGGKVTTKTNTSMGNYTDVGISNYSGTVDKSLVLGALQEDDGTQSQFFNGTVYQFAVFQRALDTSDIESWINGEATIPSASDPTPEPSEPETPVYSLTETKSFVSTNQDVLDTGVKLFESIDPKPELTILLDAKSADDIVYSASVSPCLLQCLTEDDSGVYGLALAIWDSGKYGINCYNTAFNANIDAKYRVRIAIQMKGSQVRISHRMMHKSAETAYLGEWTDVSGYSKAISQTLLVGAADFGSGTFGRYWDGTVNEVEIYQSTLTDDAIQEWFAK